MLFIVTDKSFTNFKKATNLIKNINAKLVFADRVCDTNEILSYLNQRNIKPAILPKRNRLHQWDYKSFKVLKKRDNSLIINFIVLVISLKILTLL